ncbi:MAG: GIY-YIG nuclease family protein [Pseudomonadota bacterium]
MSVVVYNLLNTALLQGMAPPALPGGRFGRAALPGGLIGGGIYIIYNNNTQNRYVGISRQLDRRFGKRMATVTEMGSSFATMTQLVAWWGTVATQNTGAAGAPTPIPSYRGPLNATIDGATVNLERLLVRYLLTQLGAGGTVSNNVFAVTPYANPTANPVTVHFNSASNAYFTAFAQTRTWPVGGAGW